MKTYTVSPSRWTPAHTIEACAPEEAELWSIRYTVPAVDAIEGAGAWVADFLQRQDAERVCAWLQSQEQS